MNTTVVKRLSVCAAIFIVTVAFQLACSGTAAVPSGPNTNDSNDNDQAGTAPLSEDGRPVGWAESTHSSKASPNYDVVFPQGNVLRLDITIASADWQAMLDDMTGLYGEFGRGEGGGGGGGAPTNDPGNSSSERLAACDGLQEGSVCTVASGDETAEGTCTAGPDGQLACRTQMDRQEPPTNPENPGGDGALPPEMLDVCDGSEEGDSCSLSFGGMTVAGTCTAAADGLLVCQPEGMPGPGGGDLPEGGEFPGGGGMPQSTDENPIYVPCTLVFEGETWWYVGVRFKGQSSLMSTWSAGIYKLPFRLDFDEFEDDHPEIDNQRFYGFKELSLASNWSDNSLLREKIAHDVFREAGVPAPHTAFCRLYIDHGDGPTYFGLYALTEIPGDPMLETRFGDDSGNLYKPTSNWVTFNEEDFDKETNEDEADFSDVQAAIAALHADRSDAAAWRAGLEAVFDVDGFLRWLAVNTVIQNWDTYGNMAQNYYLYANPSDDGRLTWVPWDNNMALWSGGGMGGWNDFVGTNGVEDPRNGGGGMGGALPLSLDEVGENWPLIRYLADDPDYWSVYVSYVRQTIETAFAVAPTQARYQAEHDLIAPYVVGDEGEQPGYTFLSDPQEFEDGLQYLLDHVQQRQDAAINFLNAQP